MPKLPTDSPLAELRTEIGRVIVGQEGLVTRLLVALLCDGHCLVEGVPGLAKSLTVSTLASSLDASYTRLQFTPDLLPADLTGSEIYNAAESRFEVRQGPIFTNVLLADEINRAPAKVQSALLEAMQERHVSIGGQTFPLPSPFLVLATQNPIEQEGTYPLPEAQLDRFMLNVRVSYPGELEEREVLDRTLVGDTPEVAPVLRLSDVLEARSAVSQVRVEPRLRDYVVQLVRATRAPGRLVRELSAYVEYGASPRATTALAMGARALAWLSSRDYATPDDVKAIALDALRHRIVLTYEAEADEVTADDVVAQLLSALPLP
ncbi:MAG: MoxR family ATPase [Chloroflexi bacterium]|nr:MoxR family ATPase [Chloroflexota bacterium]MYD17291.1 MoxR family ATPase [Chloroflexota bacterium]MYJ02128.1 MoxR family ATPase [Chloroflexota bacterium]